MIQVWALRLKGPVYVAMFKPLSIVIAVAMGVIFLGDSLHLGRSFQLLLLLLLLFIEISFLSVEIELKFWCSVVGGIIISLGFYAVLWGKAKEDGGVHYNEASSSAQTSPLLQEHALEEGQ